MPSISYAITVCDEAKELECLVKLILLYLREEDEIIIMGDSKRITHEVNNVMSKLTKLDENKYNNIYLTFFPLNNNFAEFKNELKGFCKKDYIFFIDADEFPDKYLLEILPEMLKSNPTTDVFLIARINTVKGITDEHIKKWKWNIDEKGRINYPDYQTRIMVNKPEIEWKGAVHERLMGYRTLTQLPFDLEQLALHHPKTIERQEKQNKYYSTL